MASISRAQWITLGFTALGAYVWCSSLYFKIQGALDTATPAEQEMGQLAANNGMKAGANMFVGGLFYLTIATCVRAGVQSRSPDHLPT